MKLYYQNVPEILCRVSREISIEVPFESGSKPGDVFANEYIRLEVIDDEAVLLTFTKGYGWDLNSGGIKTESWVFPSLVHDGLYHLMREGLLDRSLRKQADLAMYYFLKKSMVRGNYFSRKIGATRAKASYLGVRAFGEKHTKPRKIKIKKVRIY